MNVPSVPRFPQVSQVSQVSPQVSPSPGFPTRFPQVSLNGNIAVETFTGTYTVNSDCTTTFNVKIFASGVEILDLTMSGAFDDHMKEIRAIFTSVTTPTGTVLPTVVNLVARKQ